MNAMKKRTNIGKDFPRRDESLEDQIYDALIEQGWLIPQTEEDVLRAELALAQVECSPLPPELADPYRIIDRLNEACEITANMTSAEIEDELRGAGTDPRPMPSLSLDLALTKKSESKNLAYVYVSDDSLDNESTIDKVRGLIFDLRHLTQQKRYEEALELARQATLLDPHYWRAWISYGSLLALLGNLDEGEAIFRRVLEDFSDNPKAVAAALHNCAFAKEVRCKLNPTEEDLRVYLPMYEVALRLDDSRANTHASVLINTALLRQLEKDQKLLEDSLQREGCLDAMKFETKERGSKGAKTYKFLQGFSIEIRNRLNSTSPSHFGSSGNSVAY
jgi:tetratricopeptide (TPR) repeat protein